MRRTSSIATAAIDAASPPSRAWTWTSFTAAIARKAKRCSAMGSERARDGHQPVDRAQRLEGLAAVAAQAQRRRVVHVARGAFDEEAVVQPQYHAQRGRQPPEGSQPLVAREDLRLRARDH